MNETDTHMDIGGHKFTLICDLEPLRDPNGAVQQFMPQNRYANANAVTINQYGEGPFCKFRVPSRHKMSGVYALTVADTVRYVGECVNFSARFNNGYGNISPKNCYVGGQETNCRLNNLIYRAAASGKTVRLWFLPTNAYKLIEAKLREVLRPIWNRV